MNPGEDKVEYIKVYNETRNIGKLHELKNGVEVAFRYYKIENGVEIFCDAPSEDNSSYYSTYLHSQKHQLELFPLPERSNPDHSEYTSIEKVEVARAVENVIAEHLSPIEDRFYRTIDPKEEFGISRVLSDKIYYLPQLLTSAELIWQEGTTSYIITSSVPDSGGGSITFEHRLQASNSEEAKVIAQQIIERLRGILQKIWMATWKLANELKRFTFTCQLKELMHLAYPERKIDNWFQTEEKIAFYEHLRTLENTKILYKRKGNKEGEYNAVEFRLLEIHNKKGKKSEYPQEITLTILNVPSLQGDKLAFVGAAYKKSTLELSHDDISLASWLQARKSHYTGNIQPAISLDESFIFRLSRLESTAKTNKSVARNRLVGKLTRLVQKGIIEKFEKPQGKASNPIWVIKF